MNPYLKASANLGPQTMRRLLEKIPANRFDEALAPGRFTLREVLAHLADWEPIYRARMERVLREPGCTIEVFDEGQRAIERNYAQTDIWEQLAKWTEERAQTAGLIDTLTREQTELPLIHPELGKMTLGDTANILAGHDLYHIDQASQYL